MIKSTTKIIGSLAIALAAGSLGTVLAPSVKAVTEGTVYGVTDKLVGHDIVVKKGLKKRVYNTKDLRKANEAKAKKKEEKKNVKNSRRAK